MAQQQQPYHGPISMAESRFANPERRAQVAALLASNPELKDKKDAENILSSREKMDAGNNLERDQSDAFRFAQAQSQAIQEAVVRHTKDVERTVSSVKTTVRQIMQQIRETLQKEAPETAAETLRNVDGLWIELEKLMEATRVAKEAAPHFVEKCKENANILIAAKIQEAEDSCQWELDRKDKRAQLLQEQNAGQIQAFKDVDAHYKHKASELQERLSRVQLEQGLLREELEAAKSQLKTLQTSQDNAVKMAENLQKQVEDLKESKKTLTADNERLLTALKTTEAKLKASEEKATGDFENELRSVTASLQEEQQKCVALTAKLTAARHAEDLANKELEKAKTECNLLSDKYNSQSGVFKKMTDDLKLQTKNMTTLEDKLVKLQQEKIEVEKERDHITSLKDSLQDQNNVLETELENMKKEIDSTEGKSRQLSERLEQVEKENDELEAENREFRIKQTQHEDVAAAQKKADAEIATLRATIQNMKTTSPTTGSFPESFASEQAIEDFKRKLHESEKQRESWETLGRKAMTQFRDVRDQSEVQIKDLEKQLVQARAESDKLQAKLASANNSENEKYWQAKYNELLASLED